MDSFAHFALCFVYSETNFGISVDENGLKRAGLQCNSISLSFEILHKKMLLSHLRRLCSNRFKTSIIIEALPLVVIPFSYLPTAKTCLEKSPLGFSFWRCFFN